MTMQIGHDHILDCIPQREPIVMVDGFVDVTDDGAVTCLTVRKEHFFMQEDGLMAEVGLIEHIAQSASAVAGLRALMAGAKEPPVGYIAEIRKFRCLRQPQAGERLLTTVTLGTEVDGVTLLTGETRSASEVVATARMKIYIKPDN